MSSIATQLIEQVLGGVNADEVVTGALAEAVSGPDRQDISPEQQASMFQQLIAQSEAQVPYLNHEYVDQVLLQIRQGAPAQELVALAAKNRDEAAKTHNLGDTDFPSWDAIHRSLMATYTDQMPPNPGA